MSEGELFERRRRVESRVREAIEELAAQDLAAAASVLRIGRIKVVEEGVDTAMLQMEKGFQAERFTILLNAEFCDRPQRDLQAVLLHELLHHVMRHLQDKPLGKNHLLCNVVQDAFINRTIHLSNPDLSQFMAEYYSPSEMPTLLLRPGAKPENVRDRELYDCLYQGQLTEEELYQELKGEVSNNALERVQLLGGHYEEGEEERPVLDVAESQSVMEEIAEQLARRGREAGMEREMIRKLKEIDKEKRRKEVEQAFRKALCEGIGQAESKDSSRQGEVRKVTFPQAPHRADIYWMLSGMRPPLWRHPEQGNDSGCAVYLDVSGSMQQAIDLVYSSCLALERLLGTEIYLFSNQINKIDLEELKRGVIETSWGTDFDCVADHLVENPEVNKAVIFTDGYASLSGERRDNLVKAGKRLIGVLTPGGNRQSMDFCDELFEMPRQEG